MIPKKVNVGGLWYTVQYPYSPETDDTLLGLHTWSKLDIKIVGNRSMDRVLETLFHEMLHAVEYHCGLEGEDFHECLSQLSVGWSQVLRDNVLQPIPKRVRIGAFDYTVKFPHIFSDQIHTTYSMNRNSTGMIYLAGSDEEGELEDEFILMNFIEVLTYCICYVYVGGGEDFSVHLSRVGRSLYQVIVDNKLGELFRNVMQDV